MKSDIKGKSVNKNGFPKPKRARCFQCKKNFSIKFVPARQDYSQKNSWEYWSGEKGSKKICDGCLRNLYYNKQVYWKTVKDLGRRSTLKGYIHHNFI